MISFVQLKNGLKRTITSTNNLQDPSIVHKGKEAHTDQRKKADPNVKDTTATPQLRAEEEFDDPEVLIKGETSYSNIIKA